jgi:hypothetical protein
MEGGERSPPFLLKTFRIENTDCHSRPSRSAFSAPALAGEVPTEALAEVGEGGMHRTCPLRFARKCSLSTSPASRGRKSLLAGDDKIGLILQSETALILRLVDRRAMVMAGRETIFQIYAMLEHEHHCHSHDDESDHDTDHQKIGSLPIVVIVGWLIHGSVNAK